jgi:hypothetical protein
VHSCVLSRSQIYPILYGAPSNYLIASGDVCNFFGIGCFGYAAARFFSCHLRCVLVSPHPTRAASAASELHPGLIQFDREKKNHCLRNISPLTVVTLLGGSIDYAADSHLELPPMYLGRA